MSQEEPTGFIFGDQWPRRETVVTRAPPERDRGFQPGDLRRLVSRQVAGVAAILAGVVAGASLARADFVQSVETSAGEAMVMNPPGLPFWGAVGAMVVAMLFMVYATGGDR